MTNPQNPATTAAPTCETMQPALPTVSESKSGLSNPRKAYPLNLPGQKAGSTSPMEKSQSFSATMPTPPTSHALSSTRLSPTKACETSSTTGSTNSSTTSISTLPESSRRKSTPSLPATDGTVARPPRNTSLPSPKKPTSETLPQLGGERSRPYSPVSCVLAV